MEDIGERLKTEETKSLNLGKIAKEYRIKAQGQGRVTSEELKEKLIAFHSKEGRKINQEYILKKKMHTSCCNASSMHSFGM